MAAYIFCSVNFFLLYRRHQKKVNKYISIVFLLFIFDNLIYYMNEFLPPFSLFYGNSFLFRSIAFNFMGFIIIFCYELILLSSVEEVLGKREKFIWGSAFILQLILPRILLGNTYLVMLSILNHVLAVSIFVRALKRVWLHPENDLIQKSNQGYDLKFGVTILTVSLFLQVLYAVETMMMQVLPDLNARSLVIEVIGLFYVGIAIDHIVRLLICETEVGGKTGKANSAEDGSIVTFCERYELTKREREVAFLLLEGFSNGEIGEKLFISEGTVKTHVHNIYKKLGVNTRLRFSASFFEFLAE